MTTKTWVYRNGLVSVEKTQPSGFYIVLLRIGTEIKDKVKVDTYKEAQSYAKSFRKIAKNAK